MKKKIKVLDEIGEWSRMKHAIISQYANAYAQILNKQPALKCHYIDGFCGAGESTGKETGESLSGGPAYVLGGKYPFNKYFFIDIDERKTRRLRNLCEQQYPRKMADIEIRTGDCNRTLAEILPRFSYRGRDRILCLLDPYGLSLDWEIIKQLGHLGKDEEKGIVDLVINFSVMDMNRNAARKNPGASTPDGISRMNRAWGDDSWTQIAYKKDLFGEPQKQGYDHVMNAFCDRLKEEAGFVYAPRPVLFRASNNAPLYYLFFASHNETANKIARYLFDKYGGSA